ncbi:hypothetical protein [Actinomycetospora straminea]|uniref:Uncharacterized protein n=1 Tax=Actinomycetospora straminea TaxID=663607 RepID=A0ABP9EYX0_9PSEU|nr:hypothetical protein [Actinomycetospora straminea]MDD7931773.1 hypothetical protein [Actinomycetospora straminea]
MSDDRPPDLEFRARIRADRLRFHEEPEVRVDLTGDQDDDSTSGSRRRNLPDRVQALTTYRDIQVDEAILSWIDAPDDPA